MNNSKQKEIIKIYKSLDPRIYYHLLVNKDNAYKENLCMYIVFAKLFEGKYTMEDIDNYIEMLKLSINFPNLLNEIYKATIMKLATAPNYFMVKLSEFEKDASTAAIRAYQRGKLSLDGLRMSMADRLRDSGKTFEDWKKNVNLGTQNIAKKKGIDLNSINLQKTRDDALQNSLISASKSSRGGELNTSHAINELTQNDAIGNAVDTRRLVQGAGHHSRRFGSDVQEDMFYLDVLNSVAGNNPGNKLRSEFVATRGRGPNKFTNQANGLSAMEVSNANWDNFRSKQDIARGPVANGATRRNYSAKVPTSYNPTGYASVDTNDYLINRFNKYDVLPQFRQGNIPGIASDETTGLKSYYDNVVHSNDPAHSWNHVYNDVTNLGLNATMGENMGQTDGQRKVIQNMHNRFGQGDPQVMEYLIQKPEMRPKVMLAGMLHDIGNFGVPDSNIDIQQALGKKSRALHHGTGAAMIDGRLPTINNLAEMDQWLKMFAPEAHAELSNDLNIRAQQLSEYYRVINEARTNVQDSRFDFNHLENIFNQSGYNANARKEVEAIANAIRRHRNSSSEQFFKDMGENAGVAPNFERAAYTNEYLLPNDPMSHAVSFADKIGDEIVGLPIARGMSFAAKEGYTDSPGASGNAIGSLLDSAQYASGNADSKNLNEHMSYSPWAKKILINTRQTISDILRRIGEGDSEAADWLIDQAMLNLPGGALWERGYMLKDTGKEKALAQLQALTKDEQSRNKFRKILNNWTTYQNGYLSATDSNKALNPNYKPSYAQGSGDMGHSDFTAMLQAIENDPECRQIFGL